MNELHKSNGANSTLGGILASIMGVHITFFIKEQLVYYIQTYK